MKMKLLETLSVVALIALSVAGCSSKDTAQTENAGATQTTTTGGVQKATITIDGGKYSPSVVSVEKGKPVELTFKGGQELGCGGTIVFKSLNMSKDVESGKTVTFNFTPEQAGDIAFTCGMGMYDGKVVVK